MPKSRPPYDPEFRQRILELLSRTSFRSHCEARLALFELIEGWYTPHRLHSALDYQSPINYEKTRLAAA